METEGLQKKEKKNKKRKVDLKVSISRNLEWGASAKEANRLTVVAKFHNFQTLSIEEKYIDQL